MAVKSDEELRADLDRLRKRIRNAKGLTGTPGSQELANCLLGVLDLLADAGLGSNG